MKFETEVNGVRYSFEQMAEGLMVVSANGFANRLQIPSTVSYEGIEYAVCTIGRKAFLGQKRLREVELPASVKLLQQWAFGKCINLEHIVAYAKDLEIKKGAFDGCMNLETLCIGSDVVDDLAILRGSAMRLDAENLLLGHVEEAEIPAFFDRALETRLLLLDDSGYDDLVLCGEEDIQYSRPEYMERQRMEKVRLCLIRLTHDFGMTEEMRAKLVNYLLSHNIDQETKETWTVIKEICHEQLLEAEYLASVGGITRDNIDAMIDDLGDGHAMLKSYLILYRREHLTTANLFDEFAL